MKSSIALQIIRGLLAVALCGSLVACGSSSTNTPTVTKILPDSIAAVDAAQYADMQFLDVRTRREWDAGHVRGAVHLPVDNIGPQSVAKLPENGPFMVYCASGGRANRAVVSLRELGVSAIAVRDGGFSELKSLLPTTP